jgi:putative ABC transport system ATP-binding protein
VALSVPAPAVAVRVVGVIHIYPSAEGEVVALRGVDLEIGPGEAVALLVPSGAGKSTLLGLLAGDLTPTAGRVLVGRDDLARVSGDALARMRAFDISLVVQDAGQNLLPYATVVENVWFGQRGARRRGRRLRYSATELLALFALGHLADVPIERLSSGQRQQVALVSGVALLPRLLLVDEPTSQLDVSARDEVIETILRIHAELGATTVLVTHDPEVAASVGRTVTIRDGRVGAEGRGATQYGVVAPDGSVQLPAELADLLPAGSLVRFQRGPDFVKLFPFGGET